MKRIAREAAQEAAIAFCVVFVLYSLFRWIAA